MNNNVVNYKECRNKNSKELVSIIMPSYNTAKYISESIKSVQAQTYSNWELLLVDDCSTDNTDEVVATFLSDSRIRYVKNKKNSGAAISRNRALREARGEWIAFLDSDDLWKPNKLEHQIRFMKENKYKFSCTAGDEIDEGSKSLGVYNISPRHINRVGMYLYCWIGCLTVMYHAPSIGKIQIADLKKNNDYAMWLQVIKKADCYYLDENLASRRVRRNSISHDKLRKLIKSHYDLFRIGEGMNPVSSVCLTILNMFFGVYKKIKYSNVYKLKIYNWMNLDH